VESTVLEKYGSASARIFRCLKKYSSLEQQEVSHYCVLPLQETCSSLSKLYEDGFLFSQEIPKVYDFSSSLALYSFDLPRAVSNIVHLLHKTCANLINRKLCEVKKANTLLEKLEGKELGLKASLLYTAPSSSERISETDIKALSKLQESIKKIHASLLKIDEMLFILRDL
jgi:hypothetical protein